MSSMRDSSSTRTLYRMLDDLKEHKRSREDVLNVAIRDRLSESFKNYYDSVVRAYEKLECENELKLMRKLNKM